MNDTNLDKIIQAYLNNFDYINNAEHQEYYKWIAFRHFAENWNIEAADFAGMFKESVKLTSNLINNRTSPTVGIIKLAERPELTEKIRSFFKELFSEDDANIILRQKRAENFRDKINELLCEYEPGKWKYRQDIRAALFYLNMNRPKENFLYKYTQAHEFMLCIDFSDDFGSGDNFKLNRYYRMCEMIVKKIKSKPKLIEAHKARLTNAMLADDDYHIMAFDIIYCAMVYNLYFDIPIKRPKKKTSAQQQRSDRAEKLNAELRIKTEALNAAFIEKEELGTISVMGLKVRHKNFGIGTVAAQNGNIIQVEFDNKRVKFALPGAITSNFLTCDDESITEAFAQLEILNKRIDTLQQSANRLKAALSLL